MLVDWFNGAEKTVHHEYHGILTSSMRVVVLDGETHKPKSLACFASLESGANDCYREPSKMDRWSNENDRVKY